MINCAVNCGLSSLKMFRLEILIFVILLSLIQLALLDQTNDDDGTQFYQIGLGIADITGPVADITMLGYGQLNQYVEGIHTRLYSRAFILVDKSGNRICYVNAELNAMFDNVKLLVIEKLKQKYGDLYRDENVLLSVSHTHSCPGGYSQYLLYSLTQKGFSRQSLNAIVGGITNSIDQAHQNLKPGHVYFNQGELLDASINRSPAAYLNNPSKEREKYSYDTDKDMQILKFTDADGNGLGVATWFAVHTTSMNGSNKLVSSDNKGYAALQVEQRFNGYENVGKGPFVALFSNSNLGDASPNTIGERCVNTGLPCDFVTSTCDGKNELCIAFGPGKDMLESTTIIGQLQANKATKLLETATNQVKGPIEIIYQNINMNRRTVNLDDGTVVQTCSGAMGYSFAAGTTDGAGLKWFHQGDVASDEAKTMLDMLATNETLQCQKPKKILAVVGEWKFPYAWTAEIIPTQILKIGNLVIVGLPGEFTTMAGRRIRNELEQIFAENGHTVRVILAGLANTYSSYVTTYEEYQIQRYEAASTLFGPHTLDAYLQQYKYLARSLLSNVKVPYGPAIPNLLDSQISLIPGVIFDLPKSGEFGKVLIDALESYPIGSQVTVKFSGAHPQNNLQQDGTFLTVERLDQDDNDQWKVIATDSNWETMFIWEREYTILGTSQVTIIWNIPPETKPGKYRIRYFGESKNIWQTQSEFFGTTSPFQVIDKDIKSV